MINIKDKEIRLQLIAKYLEAETTVVEEAMLHAYYMENKADEDEQAIVRMICMEHADADLLSDEGAEEFDRIVSENQAKPRKATIRNLWIGGWAAAVTLLLVLNIVTQRKEEPSAAFNTIEIAGCIQQLMTVEDVTSVTASPVKECVLVTAQLADGTTKMYIMNKDSEEGSTSMLAIN
ncbi:MAG: hypothetical protein IKY64_04295 [Bacteroidaceae bacterium]|nr:hypothetical protein [Bacteroidaceae bacterium]